MGAQHAILSASGAHRWMNCTPSARLELEFSDRSGEAAAEGSAAHALAEHKLRKALKRKTKKPVSQYDDDEMEACTDDYAAYILEIVSGIKQSCADPQVLIEQRLDFSRYVPGGFGTGDCLIVADGTLHIVDFKYGQGVLVSAEENPQMMLYALGALELFEHLYDITDIAMTIYQPRRDNISTWKVSVDHLKNWAETVLQPAAKMAFDGEGEYVPGEHCRFCRAAVKCRVRAEEKLKLAAFEFALPPLLTDADIEEILTKLDDLTAWANDIKAYALEAAVSHGKQWQGFKLVEGRSVRKCKYGDETAVAKAAIEAGYDPYEQKLLGITALEKQLGKKRFSELLGGLIVKPPGKPTLVPLSDKRPAIDTNVKNEFMEE